MQYIGAQGCLILRVSLCLQPPDSPEKTEDGGQSEDKASVPDQSSEPDQPPSNQVYTSSMFRHDDQELGEPHGLSRGDDTDESEPESDSATSDSESLASGNFDGPLSPANDNNNMDDDDDAAPDFPPPPPTPGPDDPDACLGPAGPSTDSESGGESFSMSSDDEHISGDQSPNVAPSTPFVRQVGPRGRTIGVSMEVRS